MDIKPAKADAVFQVIETETLYEDGTIKRTARVLREGEVVEEDGRLFKTVKNTKGTLYRISIDRQIGHATIPVVSPGVAAQATIALAEAQLEETGANVSKLVSFLSQTGGAPGWSEAETARRAALKAQIFALIDEMLG